MILLFLLGLTLIGISVTLLARSVASARARTLESLDQIGTYGYRAVRDAAGAKAPSTLDTVAGAIGQALGKRLRNFGEADVRKGLVAAGMYTTPAKRFLGYQLLCAVALPLLLLWLGTVGGAPGLLLVLAACLGAATGWIAPRTVVARRAAARRAQIDYDLPELIDLLVVTMEAGLGFTASLRVAHERLPGPLGEELRLTLQEQSMGLSTMEALEAFVERCDTPAARTFVRAIGQGESLGVSIGQIMRNLAIDMRKRRRQAAEERAHKAPIKVLFPLVFLIFPAMFIVLLGPAFFALLDALG